MKDAEDSREAPRSWGGYLKDTLAMITVIRWVYREFTSSSSHVWVRRFLIGLAITTFFQLLQPWMISHIFDGIISRDWQLLQLGLGGFLLCASFQRLSDFFCSRAREWIMGLNMGSVDHCITDLFFEKSMGQHLQEGTYLHVSNIEKGRWRVFDLTSMLLLDALPVLLILVVSYLFLWILSPVTGVVMTLVIVIHLVWSLGLNQQVVEVCTPIEKDWRGLNRHRVERWESMERVKSCGKEAAELAEMDTWWDGIITRDRTFWLWYLKHCSLRGVVNLAGFFLVMMYGAWQVWRGSWHIGSLYPLYAWGTMLSFNLWQISKVEHQLNWNLPSVRSMIDALTIEPDITYPEGAPELSSDQPISVVFDNVSYAYPTDSQEGGDAASKLPFPVIKDICFEIAAGEKVALIGDSGAGKTTIMRLLLRYMDPSTGCIWLNDQKLTELNLASLMHLVGYIPQQAQVLDGTIRYNLTYGLSAEARASVTDDELWELMRLLKVDFGDRLVDGLDTVVGRNGMKLSGGQAQRLMIGAAVVKRPLLMIIDEATSSLDSTTERAVQAGLAQALAGDVSALVIAHRLSSVRYLCGRFIVVRDVSSLADGESQIEAIASSFEELYDISPTFRRLADDQEISISDSTVEQNV